MAELIAFERAAEILDEALAGLDAVLVDDAQLPEVHEFGVVVLCEGKREARVEPAVVGVTAFFGASHRKHVQVLCQQNFYKP